MTASLRRRRTYDPRLKLLVMEGDTTAAQEAGVPRSTISDWKHTPPPDVVSADVIALPDQELRKKEEKLARRVKLLVAIVVLLRALLAVSRFRLERSRITDPLFKIARLGAVERAVKAMPQRAALRILGLGATRFHACNKALDQDCPLDELPNCPNTRPTHLTLDEVRTMKDMATSPDYRHVPTSVLAILAQRAGKVFASPGTWCRYVRDRGWRRPRLRLQSSKPTSPPKGSGPTSRTSSGTSTPPCSASSMAGAPICERSSTIAAGRSWPGGRAPASTRLRTQSCLRRPPKRRTAPAETRNLGP